MSFAEFPSGEALVKAAIALGAVVAGWWVLKTALRLTLKVFTLGCFGLLALAVVGFVFSYFAG